MDLNNTDIEVRLQKTICCLADKADCLVSNYTLGNDCADVYMKEFAMVDAMFMAIENYEAQEVPAKALVTIVSGGFGAGTITVLVGALTLGSGTWNATTGITGLASVLTTSINSSTSTTGYSATLYGSSVVVHAPAGNGSSFNGTVITANVTGVVVASANPFSGGIDGVLEEDLDNNCLEESQILDMFEYISKWCGLCFAAPGSTYINSTSGVSFRITQGGDQRITEDGNLRIT